ncbi:non-ribosomal peptide synthetase [Kutzneria buriramensis]|uniref:Amino acid adenylation domain-containing protein n=1 Tax=Kutzneria buriramensis TaxID=1045776 RepID=A0A3E0HHK5_9PSEU|nr:non-ribosomal peptide synthetase [Kutzneria buriramensis]REH45979.1 amino acid adenylation domain-containing protein [Kutzneria buriramensis]
MEAQGTRPSPAELRLMVAAWNDTDRDGRAEPLIELFERHAARRPDDPAVSGPEQLTYGELNGQANRLAHHLVSLGVGPEQLVAVLLPHSAQTIVALLAVLKTGAAYLPIDPGYPPGRTAFMLEDAAPVAVVTESVVAQRLGVTGRLILVDQQEMVGYGATDLAVPVSPRHPAHVIYTSGSTGRPKGVVIERGALDDHLRTARERHPGLGGTALWHTSVAYSLSVTALFGPLTAGGCVRVAADLAGATEAVDCTFVKATPSHLPLLSSLPAGSGPSDELLLGGEALLGDALSRWRQAHPTATVTNGYGPTEVTIHCAEYRLEPGAPDPSGVVPLGRLLPNSRAYVLDERLRPVAPGVAGELYLAGSGLARGYLRRPGLTSARFVADPFGEPGSRMYRTGDVARWTEGGVLEFAGRVDDQVQIRGHRVELGEIAAAVLAQDTVAEAVVVVREDRPGDQRVVCYVVPTEPGREDPVAVPPLRDRLPEFMVPAAFVVLDALPLTRHGKVDRAALPAPHAHLTGGRAPRTVRETLLCELFADVLGVPAVGIDDDFFALGGHSLLAVQLASRIRASLGGNLTPRTVFDAPTVAALADRVDPTATSRPPLAPAQRPELIPLAPAQRRLWFLQQVDGVSSTYNVVWAARITGGLNGDALADAIGDVIARHESLRTVFPERDGEPYQLVLAADRTRPDMSIVDVTEDELDDAVATAARHAFALATDIPLRPTLFRLADDEHVLLIVTHHIVADGGSTVPLARDLSAAYQARCDSHAPDWAPLPVQYADFALWQQQTRDGDRLDAQVEHWRERLAGAPELLELPIDRPRPVAASYRGDRVRFRVDPATHRRLVELVRGTGTTVFMVLHAALAVLLTRMGAGTDVPVGAVTAGRDEEALEHLVGLFVNTLVLRTDTSGDPSFRELLSRVREVDLDAYDHQDVPFERLVEALNPTRSLAHNPLFQVVLTYENGVDAQLTAPGLASETYFVSAGSAKFDLSFFVWETRADGGEPTGIEGYLDYATDLFDRPTAESLATGLVRLLDGAAAEPDLPIGRLELLSAEERQHLLVLGNDTVVPVADAMVPDLFAEHVRRAPTAPAVVFGQDRLTYAELDARANRLARALVRCGVGPERFVCVALPKSVELVVTMLAVLKAGAAYLGIDLTYPAERIAYMIEDADPVLVLTDTESRSLLPASGNHFVLDDPNTRAGLDKLPAHDVTDEERTHPLRPHNPAFVIYTSGSTGRPKGVVVEHHGLNHYLAWSRHVYPGVSGRALVHSSVSFDLTVTGLYAPLTAGGAVHLIELDAAARTEPARPTFVKATPSHLPLLTNLPAQFSPTKQLVLGGEALLGEVLDEWRAKHPGVTVYNEYGPTETTVGCMERRIEPGQRIPAGVITLGKPSWNTQMYVLDDALRPVPFGVAGEIYIAGDLVTRGYHGRPGLTASRFVANPFGPPGSRMYRSGDIGRRRRDGEYEFVARVDDQVKVRGFRVELGEIEAVVGQQPGIDRVAVIVREDQPGDKRLVAYFVPVARGALDSTVPDAEKLRSRCAETLPEYMVPSAFVALDTLPLTPNRKLDKKALPAPVYAADPAGRTPRTAREEILCELFAQTLGVPQVSIDDNFFALGGHSLLAVRLISRIRATFGVELALRSLFESATVAALVGQLAGAGAARPALRRMPRPEEVS